MLLLLQIVLSRGRHPSMRENITSYYLNRNKHVIVLLMCQWCTPMQYWVGCIIVKLCGLPSICFIISGTASNIDWVSVVHFVQIKQRYAVQWSVSRQHIVLFERANGLWIHCTNPLYCAGCNDFYKITERLFIGKAERYVAVIHESKYSTEFKNQNTKLTAL